MNLYGKFSAVGVHKNEPNPVPNFYIEDRQTYFYESDKFFFENECETNRKEQIEYDTSIGERFPSPTNIYEIAKFGLDNPIYALNAIAEIIEQIYN